MVMVDIDPLPVVTDVYEAMKDDAPRIYPNVPNNIGARHGGHRGGDVDKAFAEAAHTIKEVIRSPRLNAVPMEGRAVAAQPD
ncbi:molybdopterin cofactor-binding domain-containing protein, partial [Bacillus pumilus]|uniref:molybdopterin cofactor-binding domain-containing protein n=1 Tax=Bacillus pumilus TaxID=1408 RepID=UPI001643DE33